MFIKRTILRELLAHLSKKEISLIVGPRQAGKTTLMLQMQEELRKKAEKAFFLSLDFERDLPHFQSQSSLIDRIKLEVGLNKAYVFIDEIQRKENAGIFLKGIYDMQLPYKFIVSGSGSLELKEKIHESLAGRKQVFEVNTLSLYEFVNYKTEYKYEDRLSDFFKINREYGQRLLSEYLSFGGYPRVALEERAMDKAMVIDEIFRSYVEKDISYLLRIEKIDAFRNLIRLLAGQAGSLINIHELSSTLGISVATVKNYLFYAEKTFIVKIITPYFKNLRKEITKSPIAYFYDLGLLNFSLGRFGGKVMSHEMGFLFQNLVYHLLVNKSKHLNFSINFWRTKDKAEVDFVIDEGAGVIPVEVKCADMKSKAVGKSLRSFIEKYNPKEAWVVNVSLKGEEKVNDTLIKFVPFFELVNS